jgi:hypothetical protein
MLNGRDQYQRITVPGHRTVRGKKLHTGGHPLKPHWWLVAIIIVLGLLGMMPGTVRAEDGEDKLGNWIGATSALRFSDKWSLFLQGELRTWEMASNLNELLWRVGGHYDFSQKYMGAFGYVRVDTWPYDDNRFRSFYENRAYQEFLIKTKWAKTKINHRFRLEQRWITRKESGTSYSNRARYMLGFTHPLNSDTIAPGTNFLRAFNEIFVDFDRGDYWFDLEGEKGLNQNRLYAGWGYQLTALSSFQLGLLWQHRPKADFLRLVLGYSHNFDFR